MNSSSRRAASLGARTASRRKLLGNRGHRGFVGFECDLLGEHYVASCQGPFGNETPPDLRLHFSVKLQNITHDALMNSISLAGVRANDFEITMGIKLRTLIRRQPFPEKMTRTRFRPILLDVAPIERTQGTQTHTAVPTSAGRWKRT